MVFENISRHPTSVNLTEMRDVFHPLKRVKKELMLEMRDFLPEER